MPGKGLLLLRQAGCWHASRHRTLLPGKRHPTTFHRLIDHRNHLNFDQLFGLS
jgi:hypothetical protein